MPNSILLYLYVMVLRFDEDFFEKDIQVGNEDFVNISLHPLNLEDVMTTCKFENDTYLWTQTFSH